MNNSIFDITIATALTSVIVGGLVIAGMTSALVIGSVVGGAVVLATR